MASSRRGIRLRRVKWPALFVVLPALLCACQDQEARAQNAALQARVEALETQVRALQDTEVTALPADVGKVTAQAAAQNCANSLTRELETFRQNGLDRRYPTAAQLALPPACTDQRVNWVARGAQEYTFTITDSGGLELARQSGS
nr:hypothetical protein [Deinococcus betulae]